MSATMTECVQKCREPFPQSDIYNDAPRPDGFIPSYIPWDKITKRLDEVFGGVWDWQIQRYEFVGNQAVVHGRLTVRSGAGFQHKDGIGCAPLTRDATGQFYQMGDDLKAAASDALKRAAVLLGIGIHLYERGSQAKSLAAQAQQAQEQSMDGPATTTDVAAMRTMFQRYGYPESWACQGLEVSRLEDVTRRNAVLMLSGQHPLAVWMDRQAKQQGQTGGVKASNA